MRWYILMGGRTRKRERWLRTAGVSADGRVFIASGLAAELGFRETEVLSWAIRTKTPFARRDQRIYVPSDWMASVFPELADVIESIVGTLREDAGEGAADGARKWIAVSV